MRLSNDLREFLESLNSRGIDYVIVGAHSLAFHGRPRYTGDLDILVRATSENAAKVVDLLNQFGFGMPASRNLTSPNPNGCAVAANTNSRGYPSAPGSAPFSRRSRESGSIGSH